MLGLVVWLVVCGGEWVCAYEVVAGFFRLHDIEDLGWGVWVLAATVGFCKLNSTTGRCLEWSPLKSRMLMVVVCDHNVDINFVWCFII